MTTAIWLSLAFLVLALLGGTAFLVVRGLQLWRTFKAFGRALEETTGALSAATERLAAASERASAAPDRLQPSLDRLRVSLARFAVLRAAISDVQDALGRLTAVYPSKT